MALINIDRHILCQLINIQTKIKLLSAKYNIEWHKIVEVGHKTEALFTPPSKGTPEEFQSLKRKVFRAERECEKYATEIAGMIYKQEALMMHLFGEVKELDTGKGKEGMITDKKEIKNG